MRKSLNLKHIIIQGGSMKKFAACAVTALLTVSGAIAQIQPVVADNPAQGGGSIDWANRVILSTGIGAPNPNLPEAAQRPSAMRAAQQIALRNALETLKGIFLSSTTTVKNFMVDNDQINSSVSGFMKGFEQEGRTKYMSDGSVEITMKIPLDGVGGIEDMLLGPSLGAKPSISKWEGDAAKKSVVFSGLIIDCSGLKVKPALSPRLLDEAGKEIYGSAYVSKEWAVKYGVVGYAKSVTDAAKLDRVGKTPGSIKGMKTSGDNNIDVIISAKDAADVRSAAENLKFLSECRVIFVID
jgi:hypothetical protein